MNWLKNNWLWLVLVFIAFLAGYEAVCYFSGEAAKAGATNWWNKLMFWKQGKGTTTGPTAKGSNCCARNCAASCVPASARTES